MSEHPTLAGELGALSLPGLLQLLSAEGRTGRVDVVAPGASGSLWLAEGDLVHAELGSGASPDDALDAMAAVTTGTFAFVAGVEAPRRSFEGRTERMLMESAVRRDHATRLDTPVGDISVPAFAPVPTGGSTPRFTTLQWQVLAQIDGRKDVATLAGELGMPVQGLTLLIRDLVAAGVLRLA